MAEDRFSVGQAAGQTRREPVRGGSASFQAAIVVACRDAAAREVLGQELRKRYGGDYDIVVCDRPAELESQIKDLLAAGTPVALVIGGVGAEERMASRCLPGSAPSTRPHHAWPPSAGGILKPRAPFSTPSPWARSITGSCVPCRPPTRTSIARSPGS